MGHITTISITNNTRDRLQSLGRMGQSFDELINELIQKTGVENE